MDAPSPPQFLFDQYVLRLLPELRLERRCEALELRVVVGRRSRQGQSLEESRTSFIDRGIEILALRGLSEFALGLRRGDVSDTFRVTEGEKMGPPTFFSTSNASGDRGCGHLSGWMTSR
jgi:hypothetical protein